MAWVAAAMIGGSLIGGFAGNSAAKKQAGANKYATDMQMRPYNDARPFITDMYSGGSAGLNNALNMGTYSGAGNSTYAGLNPDQVAALNNQKNFGNTGFGYGNNLAAGASGFGNNYNSLFNQASSGNAMNTAMNYAANNSDALVNAAMRGANRNLNEVQLTGLNNRASGSNNLNSSRAGVAEGMLRRDNAKLEADTRVGVEDNLMRRSLGQSNQDFSNAMGANAGMAGAFGTGMSTGFSGISNMLNSGSAFQKDLQNQYNDGKANFNDERDFMMNQYGKFNASILNNAPQGPGEIRPNYVDPTMSAINGAMMGGGFGNQFANFMQNRNQPQQQPNFYANYTAQDYRYPMSL